MNSKMLFLMALTFILSACSGAAQRVLPEPTQIHTQGPTTVPSSTAAQTLLVDEEVTSSTPAPTVRNTQTLPTQTPSLSALLTPTASSTLSQVTATGAASSTPIFTVTHTLVPPTLAILSPTSLAITPVSTGVIAPTETQIAFSTAPSSPTEAPPPPTPVLQSAVCPCDADSLNCSDFITQSQAQACFNYCMEQGQGDIHRLDRDNNGIVCESLP